MDWISQLRKQRISGKYEEQYGPWTPENFRGRNPVSEAVDELVDALNYIDMAQQMGKISEGLKIRLTFDLERMLNILSLNK